MTKFDLDQKPLKGQVLGQAGLLGFQRDLLRDLGHLTSREVWSSWIGLDLVASQIFGQGLLTSKDHFKVAGKEDFWAAEILTGKDIVITSFMYL
jgi:hypothetical protein